MQLLEKIKKKEAVIGIVGLGYVGLPLAIEYVKNGLKVIGFDKDPVKVSRLMDGESYIKHISSESIADMVANNFEATESFERFSEADCILICVPTPLDDKQQPDLSYVRATVRDIAKTLRDQQLIILESTTYPGTTDEVMVPILEEGGLKSGRDFLIAYSPEREDPGNPDFSTARIPKVVGANDEYTRECSVALYELIVEQIVPVGSCRIAEATKILENIYRCVNIAMVNELKMLFDRMGIDVWEVIAAASTKPFGFSPFYPGPGLGGHCIPIDPFYLTWKAKEYGFSTRFIELAGQINNAMPEYVISRTMDALNEHGKSLKGSSVFLLGLAYKKDVDDLRESPSMELLQLYQEKGAEVFCNDPFIPEPKSERKYPHLKMEPIPLDAATLKKMDVTVIATDHSCYDYDMIVKNSALIVDTRNATKHVTSGREKIVKA